MSLVALRGADAINYAEAHNLKLSVAASDKFAARDDLTPDEAWAYIDNNDPATISVVMHAALNTADETSGDDIPYGAKTD